ncbi:hypothetical protein [Sphingobacterium hungaricum]|uniref:Outer membrane protein beta-barrel domain-containing protein n=1 Tax=Sphingobacterium hungaricum TaxID=2082723 RepID=A0A928UWH9_9SPHI|nr:hypothetical protein [Sphingobacterium hungaricum]MBE8714601.1 hypothetical protein [Sphingobacterium hungaricum]
MTQKITLTFLFAIALFSIQTAQAQLTSQHAIGARFGSATGITYRYTLSEDRAAQAIMSWQSGSQASRFRLVGLYEFHKPITGDFSWFYGFGGSVGSYTRKSYSETITEGNTSSTTTYPKKSELALSIDGIVGVEYNIPTTPLAVSLDVKPYFDFIQESSIRLFDPFGFSIRYQF